MPMLNPKNWPNCIRRLQTRRDLSFAGRRVHSIRLLDENVQWAGSFVNSYQPHNVGQCICKSNIIQFYVLKYLDNLKNIYSLYLFSIKVR